MFENWPRSLCGIINHAKMDATDSTAGNSENEALWRVRAWRLVKTVPKNREIK